MKRTILLLLMATVSMMTFAQKKTSTSATIAFRNLRPDLQVPAQRTTLQFGD